jgi:hypothetical protein
LNLPEIGEWEALLIVLGACKKSCVS